ncbi:hypothetical protein D3C87_1738560 [compost metagenome]
MAPHDGQQAGYDGDHSHHLGAQAQGGAVNHRPVQARLVRLAARHQLIPGVVEVDQHQDTCLHRDACQGDKANTYGD